MEHMNRDHADALRDITRRFGGLDALDATIVSCDRLTRRRAEGVRGDDEAVAVAHYN